MQTPALSVTVSLSDVRFRRKIHVAPASSLEDKRFPSQA